MSPEDLRACYVANHERLYLAALAITLDRSAAEDAVHDALERLLRKRRRPDNPLAYIMRAVRNAAIDFVRSRGKHQALQSEDLLVARDGKPCEIGPRKLAAAFSKLRIMERETIFMHLYADLSFREIAELRGRSINTVASWYRRGITRLRAALEVDNEPD